MTAPEKAARLSRPKGYKLIVEKDVQIPLRNIGADGKEIHEVGQHGQPVPLTKGWLRASHRKTDPAKSLPYRPFHPHNERWWLNPGEPVECQIEVWPTCIVLQKGHRLRVDIQPRDGVGSAPYTHYPRRLQRGRDEHYLFGRGQAVVYSSADHPHQVTVTQ